MADRGIQILGLDGKPYRRNGDTNGRVVSRNGIPIPSVLTTSAVYRGAYHTYLDEKYDEAMRHSRENALAMERDCFLMSLLNERIDNVLGLKWSIEVDNPKDRHQKRVADGITKAVQRTPNLRQYLRQQARAIWFGRYACQVKWAWKMVDADGNKDRVLTVARHLPVNGDKISYQWFDEKNKVYTDTPYVRVNSSYTEDALGKAEYIYTSLGKAVLLKGSWRERVLIQKYNPTDADFFEGDLAGGIHGRGVRSVLYWSWWMIDEGWGIIWDALERTGVGVVLIYYELGNQDSKDAAEEMALNYSRKAVLLVPRPPGTPQSRTAAGANGVEIVQAPTEGIKVVNELRKDLEDKAERFMVGQSMSGGKDKDNGEGFGGKEQSDFARDTKRNILLGDANDIGEGQTGSEEEPGLVSVIRQYSYPWADFPVRFKFGVDVEDPGKVLEAVSKASSIGVTFKMDSVRSLIPNQEKPGPDDEVVGGQKPGAGGPEVMGGEENGQPKPEAAGGMDSSASKVSGVQDRSGDGVSEGTESDSDSGSESAGFLEFLSGLTGQGGPATYARDPFDLVMYAPQDWVSGTPSRGPNKGRQGWHNTKTKKWLFGEHPGVGEAKKEEVGMQKKAAKEQAGAVKAQAKTTRQPSGTVGDAVKLIEGLRQKPDAAGAKQLAEMLSSFRVADLKELKGHFGLKASGVKAVMAQQIAERALGDGPPVGGGHPVQATLPGVAKALGVSEEDARQRLGNDAPAFEAMLAKLKGVEGGRSRMGSVEPPSAVQGMAGSASKSDDAGSGKRGGAAGVPSSSGAGNPPNGAKNGAGTGQPLTSEVLSQSVMAEAIEGARERHTLSGMVPIHEIRQSIRQKLGEQAGRHDSLDSVILKLRQQGKVRLMSISDHSRAGPQELQDSVPGVGETLFYIEPPAGQSWQDVENAIGGVLSASTSSKPSESSSSASPSSSAQTAKPTPESQPSAKRMKTEAGNEKSAKSNLNQPLSAPSASTTAASQTKKASPADVGQHVKDLQTLSAGGLNPEISEADLRATATKILSGLSGKDALAVARGMGLQAPQTGPEAVKRIIEKLVSRKGAFERASIPDMVSSKPNTTPPDEALVAKDAALELVKRHRAEKPAQSTNPAQHASAVTDAFRKLDTRGYNLVSLADLRDELARSGLPDRAAQDAAIHDLRKKGILSLSGVEGRHAVSNPAQHKREMDAAIREGNETLGNVAMRKP